MGKSKQSIQKGGLLLILKYHLNKRNTTKVNKRNISSEVRKAFSGELTNLILLCQTKYDKESADYQKTMNDGIVNLVEIFSWQAK